MVPGGIVVLRQGPVGAQVQALVRILPIRAAGHKVSDRAVGAEGEGVNAGEELPGNGVEADGVRVQAVTLEPRGGVHRREGICHEHVLPQRPPRVDHGLDGRVEDRDVGAVVRIARRAYIGVAQGGDFGDHDVGRGRPRKNAVQQRRQMIGRHNVGVAPAADVIDPDIHQQEVGDNVRQGVHQGQLEVGVGPGVVVDLAGHQARRGDDGAANSFVLDLAKSASRGGTVPANEGERIAIGLQQRLEELAPGAIDGTIVGD